MRALLVQPGIGALKGSNALPDALTEHQKQEIMDKAHSSIILSLVDKPLREIAREKTAQVLVVEIGAAIHDQITCK